MTAEARTQLSVWDVGDILKDHGIEVTHCGEKGWVDVGRTIYRRSPVIYFKGNEGEGEKVVKIAHECGIPIFEVIHRRGYFRKMGHCEFQRWELSL